MASSAALPPHASPTKADLLKEDAALDIEISNLLKTLNRVKPAEAAKWWLCDRCRVPSSDARATACAGCHAARAAPSDAGKAPSAAPASAPVAKSPASLAAPIIPPGGWRCTSCVTWNAATARACGVCLDEREVQAPTTTTTGSWRCEACTTRNEDNDSNCRVCGDDRPASAPSPAAATWKCAACTTPNAIESVSCAVCYEDRPSPSSAPVAASAAASGWKCEACLTRNAAGDLECAVCGCEAPAPTWRCAACTTSNEDGLQACRICLEDRPAASAEAGLTVLDLTLAKKRETVDEARARVLLADAEANASSIRVLRLGTKSFFGPAAVYVGSVVSKLVNLEVADFADVIASRPEEEALRVLASLTSSIVHLERVRELDLSDNAIGETGMRTLSPFLRQLSDRLEALSFRANGLSALAMSLLAEALQSPQKLRKLSFHSNMCGDGGAVFVGEFVRRLPSLEDFSMSSCRVKQTGGLSLVTALCETALKLKRLDLSDEMLGEQSGLLLAQTFQAQRMPALEEVVLKDSGIGGKDATKALLSTFSRVCLPNLRVLDLSNAGLGQFVASGLVGEFFKGLKLHPKLESLVLAGNELGHLDENGKKVPLAQQGVTVLSQIGVSATLRALDLRANDLSDSGILALVKALEGSGVASFALDENDDVSEDVVEECRAILGERWTESSA